MKYSLINFNISKSLLLVLSLFLVQTLAKLVQDDPNLDDFSRVLFNSADFDITPDNYKIQDYQIIFDIQSLNEQAQQNILKFGLISFGQNEPIFKNYSNYMSIIFQNGPKASLVFEGFKAFGNKDYNVSFNKFKGSNTFIFSFINILSVSIQQSSFSYSYWNKAQYVNFDTVRNIQIQTLLVTQCICSAQNLIKIINSYNTTVNSFEITNNRNHYPLDLKNCDIFKLQKITFSNNYINQLGDVQDQFVIGFNEVKQVSLYEMTISNNTIKAQNFIYIFKSDVVKISKSYIRLNNSPNSMPIVQILRSASVGLVSVFVENNQHNGRLGGIMRIDSMEIDDSQISITDSSFKKNQAITSGGALYMSAQTIYIYHCKFLENLSQEDGGAIYIDDVSNFIINYVLFQSNSALQNGGAISLFSSLNGNSLNINNSTFKNNQANYGNGGALYTNRFSFFQFQQSLFDQNKAFQGDGGAIYGKNLDSIILNNLNFTENQGVKGGAIRVDKTNILTSLNAKFLSNFANSTGGACYLVSIKYSTVLTSSLFIENQAIYGGALTFIDSQSIQLSISKFEKNQALQDGGAIFLSDQNTILQLKNTQLSQNRALGIGGAVYAQVIRYEIDGESSIFNNFALIGGGVGCSSYQTYQNTYNLQLEEIVKNNTAQIYGSNIGFLPKQIILEDVNYFDEGSLSLKPMKFTQQLKLQQQEIQSFIIDNVKSPSNLVFFWKLIDQNNQVITPIGPYENDLTQIVTINNNPQIQEHQTEYNLIQKQSVLQNYTVSSETYFSTIFFVIGEPGKDQPEQISFLSSNSGNAKVFNLQFNYRDCQVGEVYIENNFKVCFECSQGTFSFDNPYNSSCTNKPDGVQLSFGSTWVMEPGYWRSDSFSTTILECQYEGSCIGGQGFGNDLCYNGFSGVLCRQCAFNNDQKYTQNLFDLGCLSCEEKESWGILQIILLAFYLIAITLLVISQLIQTFLLEKMSVTLTRMKVFLNDKRQSQRRLSIVYIKMLFHFCSISICLNQMQVQKSNISANLYVFPKYISDTVTIIIQLCTCFFSPSSGLNDQSVVFTQLLLVELFPIIFYLVGFLLIYALYKTKTFDMQQKQYYSMNLFWFCFISLFSVSIFRYLVSITACTTIGDQSRMFADINIDCDDNTTRTVFIYTFILPLFGFFGGYLPITLLQILVKQPPTQKYFRQSVELQVTQKQLINTQTISNGERVSNQMDQSKNSENYIYRINASECLSKSSNSDNNSSQQQQNGKQDNIIQMEYDVEEQVINFVKDNQGNKDLKKPLFGKQIPGKLTQQSLHQINYSYLTIGYKEEYQYWELIRFLFKQSLIMLVFFSNEIPLFAGSLSIGLYVLYLYFLNKKQPFLTRQLNNIEKESHLVQAVCLFSFVIIQLIDGDYRYDYMTQLFIFFAYFIFYWFIFKIAFFLSISFLENLSQADTIKSVFNLILPNTYKINNHKNQKKWMLIQKNIKLILSRGLDDKLFDRQFLIHQNKNLLRGMKSNRDSNEEVIELDKN